MSTTSHVGRDRHGGAEHECGGQLTTFDAGDGVRLASRLHLSRVGLHVCPRQEHGREVAELAVGTADGRVQARVLGERIETAHLRRVAGGHGDDGQVPPDGGALHVDVLQPGRREDAGAALAHRLDRLLPGLHRHLDRRVRRLVVGVDEPLGHGLQVGHRVDRGEAFDPGTAGVARPAEPPVPLSSPPHAATARAAAMPSARRFPRLIAPPSHVPVRWAMVAGVACQVSCDASRLMAWRAERSTRGRRAGGTRPT